MDRIIDRLKVYINSSSPIVVIETLEEPRAVEVARTAAADLKLPFFEWSIADGLARTDGAYPKTRLTPDELPSQPPINNTQGAAGVLAHLLTMSIEAVFVLKDLHRQMEDPVVVRRLRDVAQVFSADRRTLIITAPALGVPPELQNQVEYLNLPLPNRNRLAEIVEETYDRLRKRLILARTIDKTGASAVADNLRGLTEDEAERAVAHAIVARHMLDEQAALDVLQAKKEMLRRAGMLEFIDIPERMIAVGGLDNLKRWLARRKDTWSEAARTAGLEPPRGVIIMGVQGCGKSMCARAIAGEWGLPLVRFDTAAIYDKYVGETEKRIQKVFRIAEQLAPAVLWIDELEKVFAGSAPHSASSDAGVSSRLLAAFLSWMQDRKAAVFVAATCNNVTVLPPELIRKGRFDEIFFVDLPNHEERCAESTQPSSANASRTRPTSIWRDSRWLPGASREQKSRPPSNPRCMRLSQRKGRLKPRLFSMKSPVPRRSLRPGRKILPPLGRGQQIEPRRPPLVRHPEQRLPPVSVKNSILHTLLRGRTSNLSRQAKGALLVFNFGVKLATCVVDSGRKWGYA